MEFSLEPDWRERLDAQLSAPYFRELMAFVSAEYARGEVYPPARFVFEAFNRTPFGAVKAVILGQDPYPNPGQAHGLCFSVQDGTPLPRSLVNIYTELESEYHRPFLNRSGDLSHWADQGVLLLNATLTVKAHTTGSHQKKGWERFTDSVVRLLSEQRDHLVFLLWGAHAQKKGAVIDRTRHFVLETVHPSPLSARRGFFGCNHFRQANAYLRAHGLPEIAW
ncbi:MAG: uracil-DNA glycosylase [Kiritimatiellia bacterium]